MCNCHLEWSRAFFISCKYRKSPDYSLFNWNNPTFKKHGKFKELQFSNLNIHTNHFSSSNLELYNLAGIYYSNDCQTFWTFSITLLYIGVSTNRRQSKGPTVIRVIEVFPSNRMLEPFIDYFIRFDCCGNEVQTN